MLDNDLKVVVSMEQKDGNIDMLKRVLDLSDQDKNCDSARDTCR